MKIVKIENSIVTETRNIRPADCERDKETREPVPPEGWERAVGATGIGWHRTAPGRFAPPPPDQRAAQIDPDTHVVVNVSFFGPGPLPDGWTECPTSAGIGWTEQNGEFLPPAPEPVPEPTFEERVAAERAWRNRELAAIDVEINKREDVGEGANAWRQYRAHLREWPAHAEFPDSDYRPFAPTGGNGAPY